MKDTVDFLARPLPNLEQSTLSPLERLQQAIEAHVNAESESLTGYRALADRSDDQVVRLIMRLVLEDEERHHRLLAGIAARLRDDLEWHVSPEALPSGGPASPAVKDELARVLAYVHEEREGARHMRELAKEHDDLHGGFVSLLLEWMALDSEKHERALRYVLGRLRGR